MTKLCLCSAKHHSLHMGEKSYRATILFFLILNELVGEERIKPHGKSITSRRHHVSRRPSGTSCLVKLKIGAAHMTCILNFKGCTFHVFLIWCLLIILLVDNKYCITAQSDITESTSFNKAHFCLRQGCTNPGHQVVVATKFCRAVPNICGCSVWNVLYVPFWRIEFGSCS
jgi:hypothetical protein